MSIGSGVVGAEAGWILNLAHTLHLEITFFYTLAALNHPKTLAQLRKGIVYPTVKQAPVRAVDD